MYELSFKIASIILSFLLLIYLSLYIFYEPKESISKEEFSIDQNDLLQQYPELRRMNLRSNVARNELYFAPQYKGYAVSVETFEAFPLSAKTLDYVPLPDPSISSTVPPEEAVKSIEPKPKPKLEPTFCGLSEYKRLAKLLSASKVSEERVETLEEVPDEFVESDVQVVTEPKSASPKKVDQEPSKKLPTMQIISEDMESEDGNDNESETSSQEGVVTPPADVSEETLNDLLHGRDPIDSINSDQSPKEVVDPVSDPEPESETTPPPTASPTSTLDSEPTTSPEPKPEPKPTDVIPELRELTEATESKQN